MVFVDTYFLFPESLDFLHEVRAARGPASGGREGDRRQQRPREKGERGIERGKRRREGGGTARILLCPLPFAVFPILAWSASVCLVLGTLLLPKLFFRADQTCVTAVAAPIPRRTPIPTSIPARRPDDVAGRGALRLQGADLPLRGLRDATGLLRQVRQTDGLQPESLLADGLAKHLNPAPHAPHRRDDFLFFTPHNPSRVLHPHP